MKDTVGSYDINVISGDLSPFPQIHQQLLCNTLLINNIIWFLTCHSLASFWCSLSDFMIMYVFSYWVASMYR